MGFKVGTSRHRALSPRGGVEVPLHGRGTLLHRADNVLRWRKTSAVVLSLVGGQKLEDVVPDRGGEEFQGEVVGVDPKGG